MQFKIEEQEDATICSNAGATLELVPRSDQKYAITRIRVSLTRPMEATKTIQFGENVVLKFSDGLEAVWEFRGKTN